MNAGLHTNNLVVGHKTPLLSDVSLELGSTGIWPVIGRNGSGKTTLLLTLAHLLQAKGGSVNWNDKEISAMTHIERARLMSVVLTERMLPGGLDVKTLVAMGRFPYLGNFSKPGDADLKIIDEALHALRIDHLSHRKLYELSDGEKQKTLIARALCQDTPIMILDEPAVFLDYIARKEIIEILSSISKDRLVIYSTHELESVRNQNWSFIHVKDGSAIISTDLPQLH